MNSNFNSWTVSNKFIIRYAAIIVIAAYLTVQSDGLFVGSVWINCTFFILALTSLVMVGGLIADINYRRHEVLIMTSITVVFWFDALRPGLEAILNGTA